MCGLVYVKRKDGKSAVKSVKKRYRRQKYRGQDGFGYVAIKNDKIVSYQRAPTEHEIMLKLEKEDAPEILFHHRFPTSTPNMEEQAHPLHITHESFTHEYYVAHNGVIRNPFLRKLEHDKLGIKYATALRPLWQTTTDKLYIAKGELKFNDSEALAVDTALALEGKLPSIDTEGSAAVITLQVKDGKVVDRIFYRNNLNPLKYEDNSVMTTLTSVGGGADIDTIHVMRFEGSTPKKHPASIWTPSGYSSHYNNKATPPKVYGLSSRAEDDYAYGYAPGEDWDIDFPSQRGEPKSLILFPKAASGVMQATITAMNDDILWEEYDKSLATIKQLETGIEMFDGKVAAGIISEGIVTGRERLQQSLDKTEAYKKQLDKEISTRISTKSVRNVTG